MITSKRHLRYLAEGSLHDERVIPPSHRGKDLLHILPVRLAYCNTASSSKSRLCLACLLSYTSSVPPIHHQHYSPESRC